jgi:hypothetical protein
MPKALQRIVTLRNFGDNFIGFPAVGGAECVTIAHQRPNAQAALEKRFRLGG